MKYRAAYNKFSEWAATNGLLIDKEFYAEGDLVLGFTKEAAWKKKPCFSYPYKDKSWDFSKACDWVLKCLAS